ncbi:MAG: hypothetical protein ACAH80_12995 [Alphaproteobacteria bacterium]
MTMRYFLPVLMVFALAMPAASHASGGRECGPHLQQQMDQAKKAAEYAIELEKGQIDQAKKAAEYAAVLEKGQIDQAKKAAEYAVVLEKGQIDQARKAAEYAEVLAKGQADQARKAAEYARQLDADQRKVLQYYANLCAEQTTKFNLGSPVPQVREAAAEQQLKGYIAGGKSMEPPPPLPTSDLPTAPGSPVTENNALGEPKPNLEKALGDVEKQQ